MQKITKEIGGNDSDLPHFQDREFSDEKLLKALHNLFIKLDTPNSKLTIDSILVQTFSELILKYADVRGRLPRIGNERPAIKIVREYIKANYADNISIEKLSNLVNLSPYYLIRNFRNLFGLPPHAYQNQLRLQAAKKDLLTKKPLATIALENGFYDQSHLNKHFKRTFGVTPNNYRKSNFILEN